MKNAENCIIRNATADDADQLSRIYGCYVKNTAASFEYTPPTAEEMTKRITAFSRKYPYLVIEDDGQILGFSYAHALIERPACDYAAECSIYLDQNARHQGCGRALYTALENELKRMNVTKLYACIATADKEDDRLNTDSPRFHRVMGYRQCGEFHHCGYKFGRWYNLIWMQKKTADLSTPPPPMTPYPDVLLSEDCAEKETLSFFDKRAVRLVTRRGELFIGKAAYCCTQEEVLEIGRYSFTKKDIRSIEAIG